MDPVTLIALALGGVALLGGKKKTSLSTPQGSSTAFVRDEDQMSPVDDAPDQNLSDQEMRYFWLSEIRNMSNWYSNEFGSMPLLADYLTVVGFIESRFNPSAANPQIETNYENAARGFFGIRPHTAFKSANGLTFMRQTPDALYNPRWSFVIATFLIWQACNDVRQRGSGEADWAAVRRWWGYPSKVHDFGYEDPWSEQNTMKLERGIDQCNEKYGTDIDPDFIWRRVEGWENYPGIEIMIKSFGLSGADS